MMKAKLIIAGEERWLTNFHYEYFYPIETNLAYADSSMSQTSANVASASFQNHFLSEDLNIFLPSFDNAWLTKPVAFPEAETFDTLLRPADGIDGTIRHQMAGGLFNLSFASSEHDEFFLEWLMLGTMKEGRFELYNGDDDHFMKIEFWDCYCVGFHEAMALGCSPMQISLRLSPAITRNRNVVEHEKNWKVTDIHGEWKAGSPQTNQSTEKKKLLITNVEGKTEALPGQVIEYKVSSYSDIASEQDKNRVKWAVKVNGEKKDFSDTGELVRIKIEQDWAGKSLVVMPYLDSPTGSVSVRTRIVSWELPKYFAKSAKEPGFNEDGTVAEDMTFSTTTNQELIDYNKLFWVQANASDKALFADMYILARSVSIRGGWENSKALINHFRNRSGATFTSEYLDNALAAHPTLQQFIYEEARGVFFYLKQQLKEHNGNINNIDFQDKTIRSTRVKFSSSSDKLNGLTFSVNDTHSYKIYIEDYVLKSNNTFDAKLRIEIYDHFGLDFPDIEKFVLGAGFRAWYVLQHVKGYKPFMTKMTCIHEIINQSF